MVKPPIPAELQELLGKPNPAVMATVRPDGAPVSVATWYLWEDGHALVTMDAERRRLEHVRHDPRVSLTVLDGDRWYVHVSVQGRATLLDDPGLEGTDRIARHYTGKPYSNRERPRVLARIDVDRWHVWGR